MSKLTDGMLISFCDLMNLKMEYANTKYMVIADQKEKNHTIASLLKLEFVGIEQREADGMADDSIIHIAFTEKDNIQYQEAAKASGARHDSKDTIPRRERMTEYLELNKEKVLGAFYNKVVREYKYSDLSTPDEVNNKKYHILNNYIYRRKGTMRGSAPVVMEQFDRYCQNESGSPFKYLDEYEILGVYDNYNLCKEAIWNVYEESYDMAKKESAITKLRKEELFADFPLRDEVEHKVKEKYILNNMISGLQNPLISGTVPWVFSGLAGGSINFLQKQVPRISTEAISLMQSAGDIYDVSIGTKVIEKAMEADDSGYNAKVIEDLKNKFPEEKGSDTVTFTKTFQLSEAGFAFSILKHKDGKDIIIVVRNDEKLSASLNKALNRREYPKEIFLYDMFFEKLKEQYGSNIIITGYENGGKLAELLGTYYDFHTRVFYENEHNNMGNWKECCKHNYSPRNYFYSLDSFRCRSRSNYCSHGILYRDID